MQQSNFKPLLSVGREYIRDISPEINDEDLDRLSDIMEQFIMNRISFEVARNFYENTLGSVMPIQKIAAILIQCNIPPNSLDARFLQAQALTNMANKKMRQWTEIEDQRLLSGIHKFGLDNWALVAAHLGNTRTRAQCSQRWFRGLDPRILKATWTIEEEETLLELVNQYGDHSWTKVANSIGNRSDAQCRYHYFQILKEKQGIKLRKRQKNPQLPAVMSAPSGSLLEIAQLELKKCAASDNEQEEPHQEKLPSIQELISNLPRDSFVNKISSISEFINIHSH